MNTSQSNELLWLLLPMVLGWFVVLPGAAWMRAVNRAVNLSVYAILPVMGWGLARLGDLGGDVLRISAYAALFLSVTLLFNTAAAILFDRLLPWDKKPVAQGEETARNIFSGCLKQLLCVAAGAAAAMLLPGVDLPGDTVSRLLMILLFLIATQLRNNGISLRSVLLNRRGLQLAFVCIVATLAAAFVPALILDIPLRRSLALNSGFGWYSLSGSVLTRAYGSFWGAVALLIDLGREFVALMFIPPMMRFSSAWAIATGGATALDFTLPVIYRAGGVNATSLAIAYGFVINIAAPILLVFFSGGG